MHGDSQPSPGQALSGQAATLDACLDAVRAWEPAIDAWTFLPGRDAFPSGDMDGPLAGVPFGVKDVIDVHGMPTGLGWDALPAPLHPDADAAVVAALRGAGAVPLGKTRSTAFAFTDPTDTRNPWDPARTPGGSSSGSGAAVGAGTVPFALGTQTAGSLCRPAAFCGGWAWKPGLGVLPADGMCPLSESFDAIGVIARDWCWLDRVYRVLADAFGLAHPVGVVRPMRIGRVTVPGQTPVGAMVGALDTVARAATAAGHVVATVIPDVAFTDLVEWHRRIMLAEAVHNIARFTGGATDCLPPRLKAGLEEGATLDPAQVAEARQKVAAARAAFWRAMRGFDMLLACPVPGAAPVGLQTTGDQSYLTPWTVLGGPLVTLPAGLDDDGMPLGALLAAAPGNDGPLMGMAAALARVLPALPRPRLPSGLSPSA
ncbi:MAG: amidase [Pseudomonadota bacterium]|nr:amidase [Pseudomonadota bacterium]